MHLFQTSPERPHLRPLIPVKYLPDASYRTAKSYGRCGQLRKRPTKNRLQRRRNQEPACDKPKLARCPNKGNTETTSLLATSVTTDFSAVS